MRLVRRALAGAVVLGALAFGSGASGLADVPTLAAGGSPPEAIPEEIRAALDPGGQLVTLASGTTLEFWFRSEVPGGSDGPPGVTFAGLGVGTLVGAVRITGPWSDYKGNPIEPGVFTLRYGVRPEDGNHMGVSVHLDFVLLVPTAEDPSLEAGWGQDDLNIMSFGATGIGHPGVMSLAPNYEGAEEPVIFQDDADGWALAWPAGSFGGLTLGFVVEGEGEH